MTKNKRYPSIDDIVVIDTKGEWPTKSGGTLGVLYKIDYQTLTAFLSYDQEELDNIPVDIRGLRSYVVSGVAKGQVGANEWHRIRNEINYCLNGSFLWSCRDLYGSNKDFMLDKNTAVLTPHHILHTYTALEDDSAISVTANTLFFPDNSATFDTYPAASFAPL